MLQLLVALIGRLGLQLLEVLLAHVDRRVRTDGGGGEERAEEGLTGSERNSVLI